MILSGADVQQYIRFGGLRFDPPLSPDQLQQNGVDMILEEVDTRTRYGMDETGEPFLNFPSFPFCLGRTREKITMPNDLMAFVHIRSTWARKGFFLPGTVIDAGFEGTITLEIASFQWNRLPIGQRFAHIIFAKLASPSDPYRGKYQGQHSITQAK